MRALVQTTAGTLEGAHDNDLYIFRGIPFAAPPDGERRFRPPQPPQPWTGIRSATHFGKAAPQPVDVLGSLLGFEATPTDESCLYLNVWTPGLDRSRRPVMVWIHGGAFVLGTGAREINDGAALARRGDVVVVTLNYRLGALGFLHLDGGDSIATSGNEGILDQVAALEWVQREIEAFGGDPNNVTIFGESAGAISVTVLLALPRARGLFHRAIAQSGSANLVATTERASPVTQALLRELGLTPASAARLRELSTDEMFAAQLRVMAVPPKGVGGLPFLPVIDGDVLPGDPFALIRAGCARNIPLLIGTTSEEMKLFTIIDAHSGQLDDAALVRRCERNIPGTDGAGMSHGRRVVETYRRLRAARGESTSPADLWSAIESDRLMRYPAMHLGELQAVHQRQTYAYLFTWPSPFMDGALGACHALDVPFVFASVDHPKIAPFAGHGPDARHLANAMQDAWVHFARSGNPNHPGLPAWSPYDAERRATMILGRDCRSVDAPYEEERRFWEVQRPA